MLADRVAALIDASVVGLLLADQRGHLEFVAGSDENAKLLELFQIQNHEGPCLDAFRFARPVINADLQAADTRWPRFVIEQAKGAIAQVQGVSVDEAFARVRDHARRTNRRLSEVAYAIVTNLAGLPELAAQEPSAADRPDDRSA